MLQELPNIGILGRIISNKQSPVRVCLSAYRINCLSQKQRPGVAYRHQDRDHWIFARLSHDARQERLEQSWLATADPLGVNSFWRRRKSERNGKRLGRTEKVRQE